MIRPLTPEFKPIAAKRDTKPQPPAGGFASAMQSTLGPNLPDQANPFSPAAFENRMNAWLVSTVQQINARALDAYNQAMADWKLNDTRCRQLGIPSPPQPQPPKLEAAEAKPAGWWFRNDLA
ncbi:MAG: hypothetical protein ACE15B_06680 [Bryobacteraceae bacterium]